MSDHLVEKVKYVDEDDNIVEERIVVNTSRVFDSVASTAIGTLVGYSISQYLRRDKEEDGR